MDREVGKEKQGERRRTGVTLLSRRVFLSSIAATGVTAMWPGSHRGGVGLAQENAPPPLAHAAFPPPVGQEASYQWYLGQYTDPTMFTPVGLPADPAETAVSPNGALLYANDLIGGPPHSRNALCSKLAGICAVCGW